jgi:cytochrome c biogenesis protein CcmG/thiol:disulfide interchange protein DsbE
MIGTDERGRAAIDWGVYGVPETFIISKDGTILFKHVGPLTLDSVRRTLMPEIEKALAG